jgi:hypothetical protein
MLEVELSVEDVIREGVVIMHKDPSGNVTTLTYGVDAAVVKDGTGIYHVDVDVDEEGRWFYRCEGSGTTQQAVCEGEFLAQDSEFY